MTNLDNEYEGEISKANKKKQKGIKGFFAGLHDSYIPTSEDSLKERITKVIVLLCIVVFIVSSVSIVSYYYKHKKLKDLNQKLQALYSQSDSSSSGTSSDNSDSSSESGEKTMLPSFEELYKLNPEVVGWIEIPNSSVNYPALQTKDNSFYLNHDYMKNKSETGAIFVDYRYNLIKDGTPDNTIIYGHNTLDGTFFGALHQYKKLNYIKTHPIIKFNTLYEENQYKIFACFFANVEPEHDNGVVFDYHNRILFSSEADFKSFYDEVMKRSYYNTDVDVKYGDELLTLSTCSLEIDNARFVIVARKVRPGESPEVNTDKIVENKNKYMPLEWYKVNKIKPPR
jgi:sortase B